MFVPDTTWIESTLNYNNAPAVSGLIISSLQKVSPGNWYEFDMTPLISGDGVYTVRVSSASSNGAAYYAQEATAGFSPALVVTLAQ